MNAILVTRFIKALGYVCAGFMYGAAATAAIYDSAWSITAIGGSVLLASAIAIRVPTQ